MPSVVKVEEMGSLWVSTAAAIAIAKQEVEKDEKKRRNFFMGQNVNNYNEVAMNNQEAIIENMKEVNTILKKAGIKKYFPFEPQLNENKEIIGFVPKGKNDKEIKENIMEYKDQMKEALEKGKITEEEFEKLDENLDELMKENDIELEEEKEMEVTDEQIMDNIKEFILHNYGEKDEFAKECENYKDLDLDDRKFKLQDINSKINTQLGIVGDLHFSTNPNLKFGDSFFTAGNGGYYLTEKEVMEKGLGPALYTMMEKSLMRQREQEHGKQIDPREKEKMHKKILEEKRAREQQRKREQDKIDKKNAQKAKQYMRNIWNG